jgi:Tol biopolymer transport system component
MVTVPPPLAAGNDGGDHHPKLSPNGTKILYDRAYLRIMIVAVDGTGLRELALGCNGECLDEEHPAWSPDATQIAFERAVGPIDSGIPRYIGIWVAAADGSGPRQLTQFDSDSGWEDHSPSFSPDGRQLLFMRDGNHPDNLDLASIWTIGVNGKDLHLVYRLPVYRHGGGGNARWSPDGSRILFSDASLFEPPAYPFVPEIFTVRPDGTDLQQLTQGSFPAWSPDGEWIVFLRPVYPESAECPGARNELYVMKADGTQIRRISQSTAAECLPNNPDWGV